MEGLIVKALSGFYYVQTGEGTVECRARGRFRLDGSSPLVGDRCEREPGRPGPRACGRDIAAAEHVHPPGGSQYRRAGGRRLRLRAGDGPVPHRPRGGHGGNTPAARFIVCVNKADTGDAGRLAAIYAGTGYTVVVASAVNGDG